MFFGRVTPSGQFDVLSEEFGYKGLVGTVVALVVCIVGVRGLVSYYLRLEFFERVCVDFFFRRRRNGLMICGGDEGCVCVMVLLYFMVVIDICVVRM